MHCLEDFDFLASCTFNRATCLSFISEQGFEPRPSESLLSLMQVVQPYLL